MCKARIVCLWRRRKHLPLTIWLRYSSLVMGNRGETCSLFSSVASKERTTYHSVVLEDFDRRNVVSVTDL
jgi:hypothetical protein